MQQQPSTSQPRSIVKDFCSLADTSTAQSSDGGSWRSSTPTLDTLASHAIACSGPASHAARHWMVGAGRPPSSIPFPGPGEAVLGQVGCTSAAGGGSDCYRPGPGDGSDGGGADGGWEGSGGADEWVWEGAGPGSQPADAFREWC